MLGRLTAICAGLLATVACGQGESGADGSGGSAGAPGLDPNGNPDGDCLTTGEELAKGTNPELADSDGDGDDDCKEVACKSNPTDAAERCYTCGWERGDPGNLASTGIEEGDVIENVPLVDQCGETVPIWDFAGAYHILFMTAAW